MDAEQRSLRGGGPRKDPMGRGRAVAGLVVALLGVATKTYMLGGFGGGGGDVELLDPRYGGVDGLGVLGGEGKARVEQLHLHSLFHDPVINAGRRFSVLRHTAGGSLLDGFNGEGRLPGVNVDALDVGDAERAREVRRPHVSNPYGVLARTEGERDPGGVLARVRYPVGAQGLAARRGMRGGERVAVDGVLSAFKDRVGGRVGASLASQPDNSWKAAESAALGGVLFDKSLGEDSSWKATGAARPAPAEAAAKMCEHAIGALGALPDGGAGGALNALPTVEGEAGGVLAGLPMTNPDGVLAEYGHTGEYAEKEAADKQALRGEKERLGQLKQFEAEATALHKAQAQRLAALEEQEALEHKVAAVKADEAKQVKAAARKAKELLKTREQLAKARAAEAQAAANAKAAVGLARAKAAGKAARVAAHSQHKSLHKTQHLAEAVDEAGASPEKQAAGRMFAEDGGDVGEEEAGQKYSDIGWAKTQWNTGSWVMFSVFGPVFTVLVTLLVWHCAGLVAALVMLFVLLCLDVSAYYYSWFLV